jgi:uncharacterized repeat protein (TIGR03803 family)
VKRIIGSFGKLDWGKRTCAVLVLTAATLIALRAQTLTTLYSFNGTDGGEPVGALVQGTDGDLYGTTEYGGAGHLGTVFKITLAGNLTTLHTFCPRGYDCADGEIPLAGLVQASSGDFYGTTSAGGAYNAGAIFKITPGGTLTTLHSFCAQSGCPDGATPVAGLIQTNDSDLYGTTSAGGADNPCPNFGGGFAGCGTVFKITPNGALTTLYSFCAQNACADGVNPIAGLVQASNGDLYGTTQYGGASNECGYGCGTVFRVTPGGAVTTLYAFSCSQSGCADGYFPRAGLIQARNGDFYGTTFASIFKITPSGAATGLYLACSSYGYCPGTTDPWGPVQATNGDLYGTTYFGGPACETYVTGCGTVFEITPSGTLTTLYTFTCSESQCANGGNPDGGLVQATNGNLYGTTYVGGPNGGGTVFSLSVGLKPFVETEPASGKAGTLVKILGNDLSGATSVTFNGCSAPIEVFSQTVLTTTVPTCATTGPVQVITPRGTLSSNVPFRVLP